MTAPATFPTLPGLGFSFIKRPKWHTLRAVSASGRDVRAATAAYPTWEWELTYDFLRDPADYVPPAAAPDSELKTLLGFVQSQSGALTGFLFKDPDDNAVTGQTIASGDGATTTFTIVRSLGNAGALSPGEPVGYVDTGTVPLVYLNGALQGSGYTIDQTTPGKQLLTFTSAPGSGVSITMTFAFFYYVHFKDDTEDFEKFSSKIWSVKKLTLESLKA